MSEISLAEFHRLRWLVWIVTVVLIVVVVVFVVRPMLMPMSPDAGDGEPGSKRFDHFSFHNASGVDADNVTIWLKSAGGGSWWTCTSTGYTLGPVKAGETVTWVMNHAELEAGVETAICRVDYLEPSAGTNWMQRCEVPAYAGYHLNSATFWFGHPNGAAPAGPPATHVLCGEALMTGTGNVRIHRPHATWEAMPAQ